MRAFQEVPLTWKKSKKKGFGEENKITGKNGWKVGSTIEIDPFMAEKFTSVDSESHLSFEQTTNVMKPVLQEISVAEKWSHV